MYDYGFSTLTQYQLTVRTTARTRGGLLCQTDQGPFLIREMKGSEKKLLRQQELLVRLQETGSKVDTYFPNKEGELISCDKDGIPYTLQRWFEGRECDTRSKEEVLTAVRGLAVIHKEMQLPVETDYMEGDLSDEYRRHNQELRKIRRFIRKKGPSSIFEKEYLRVVEWFLERAESAEQRLKNSSYQQLRKEVAASGKVCHGEYNQHNVLILKRGIAITGFSHWCFGIQVGDLYRFMRKILEKYNWDPELAEKMLKAYDEINPISEKEWENLKLRFCYPDKFWKLSNYYYTHKKAWISEKNTEKLQTLIAQRNKWDNFCKEYFR
nr:CotS family spore coat protein [uncultured Blautia sp.]